jgi:hypothetical protein
VQNFAFVNGKKISAAAQSPLVTGVSADVAEFQVAEAKTTVGRCIMR